MVERTDLEHILGPGHIVELALLAVVADVTHVGEPLRVKEVPGRLGSEVDRKFKLQFKSEYLQHPCEDLLR